MNSPTRTSSKISQVQRRSPRLAKAAAASMRAGAAGYDDKKSIRNNTAGIVERTVGASDVTPKRGRQGRRASMGCRPITPGTADDVTANVSMDDGNISFCTADGEAEPAVDVDHTASVAKSNLFESCVSDAPPASSPTVVSSECPSTIVEKMSSLKLDQGLPDSCDNSGVHEGTGVNDSAVGERVDVSVGGAPEEHLGENSAGWLQPPSPTVAPEVQRPKNSKGCQEMPSFVGSDARAVSGLASRRNSRGVSIEHQTQQGPRGRTRGRSPVTRARPPSLVTMQRAKRDGPLESSEEAEIRKQNTMREELKLMKRRNQLLMERNNRTVFIGNVRSSQPLTVPEGPAMKTASRLGERVYSAATGKADQEGTHSDRDQSMCSQWKPKGPTVPEPFHLSTTNRPGSVASTLRSREECFTFREHIAHMESKVPDRFIKKPSGEHPKSAASAVFHPKPTVPRSPRFLTEIRAAVNKTHVKTPEEREEEDLAYMKKHQFKARRYSSDGFGISGEQGVLSKHHSDKPLTKQEPFRLSTGSRPTRNVTSKDDDEISKQFKARPMPIRRSSSTGRLRPGSQRSADSLPNAGPRSLTVAESPALSTKRRSVLRTSVGGWERMKSSEEVELENLRASQFKARPMPDYVKARRQSINSSEKSVTLTEIKPFNLRSEERGRAKQALLEQRLIAQRRQEEAATRVRARPLPSHSQDFVPQRSSKPLTETEDFHLSSEARHERAEREFQEKIRREEEEARLASRVVALPLPTSTFQPEPYPGKTEVSLTQPEEVMLHSSLRAQERAQWDRENEARLEAEKRERDELEENIAAAERRQIEELRRRPIDKGGMAFKAKPIPRTSNPPEPCHLSTAPLTTPITPNLRTMRRARNDPYGMGKGGASSDPI